MVREKYYSDNELAERYSVTRTTIWRWIKVSGFPKPVRLGKGTTRWKLSEVELWEAQK